MDDADRHRLHFGPYPTPRFRYGAVVWCEVRGEVTIAGLTDAPIPWPVGKRGRAKSLVVYKGLAKALRWVEASGGAIRLESRVGQGTRAIVLLPAGRQAEVGEAPAVRRREAL